jgi:DNA-binding NarL/FixJ family response regulator
MSFSILIVDDSVFVRRALRSCIERNTDWHVCGEAENGKLGVLKAGELNPDVVILDFQMPVMNGIDAARRITTSAPHTALVMLTMHNDEQLRREAKSAGIKDVLSKSENVADQLVALLRNIFAGSAKAFPRPPPNRFPQP